MIIKMHLVVFYLKGGIFTHHAIHVLSDLLMSKTAVSCKGHGCLDSLYRSVPLKCLAHRRTNSVYTLHCVCEEALGSKRDPAPSIPTSHNPLGSSCSVFVFCDDRPGSPERVAPLPAPPSSGTRQHFLLSFGSVPHWFEHRFLISSDSLYSLHGPRRPFARRFSLRPLLSRGFLFISSVASVLRLCLALSLFSPFLRSLQAPQWDPCFPCQRFFSALSVVFMLTGETLFIYFFGSGEGTCMYYFLFYGNPKDC